MSGIDIGSLGNGVLDVAGMVKYFDSNESEPSRSRAGTVDKQYEYGSELTTPFVYRWSGGGG